MIRVRSGSRQSGNSRSLPSTESTSVNSKGSLEDPLLVHSSTMSDGHRGKAEPTQQHSRVHGQPNKLRELKGFKMLKSCKRSFVPERGAARDEEPDEREPGTIDGVDRNSGRSNIRPLRGAVGKKYSKGVTDAELEPLNDKLCRSGATSEDCDRPDDISSLDFDVSAFDFSEVSSCEYSYSYSTRTSLTDRPSASHKPSLSRRQLHHWVGGGHPPKPNIISVDGGNPPTPYIISLKQRRSSIRERVRSGILSRKGRSEERHDVGPVHSLTPTKNSSPSGATNGLTKAPSIPRHQSYQGLSSKRNHSNVSNPDFPSMVTKEEPEALSDPTTRKSGNSSLEVSGEYHENSTTGKNRSELEPRGNEGSPWDEDPPLDGITLSTESSSGSKSDEPSRFVYESLSEQVGSPRSVMSMSPLPASQQRSPHKKKTTSADDGVCVDKDKGTDTECRCEVTDVESFFFDVEDVMAERRRRNLSKGRDASPAEEETIACSDILDAIRDDTYFEADVYDTRTHTADTYGNLLRSVKNVATNVKDTIETAMTTPFPLNNPEPVMNNSLN